MRAIKEREMFFDHSLNLIHATILQWYQLNGRKELPWRNLNGKNAPYGVYVSEIMLQQTQVSRVLKQFYDPFLNTFPTLEALSKANEAEVLYLWRGLGYYSRARNMLKTAQICKKFLPSELKELIKLPGIGVYTAGAIACFGFGRAVSFVDGNIKRVLSRFFGLKNPSAGELKKLAQEFLNLENSFVHNQALLDIGATICMPTSPKCVVCPLKQWCKGRNNPLNYTQKTKIIYENIILNLGICIFKEGKNIQKVGLVQSSNALYRGLYNFPKLKNTATHVDLSSALIGELKHSHTRYRLKLLIYLVEAVSGLEEGVEFFSPYDLKNIPISGMTIKILDYIQCLGLFPTATLTSL